MSRRLTVLPSGLRDRLITIQKRGATDTPDSTSGEPTVSWTTLVANMPAGKLDLSGSERFTADQVSARYDQKWEINYRADMDPELVDVPKLRQLVVNGRTLEIVAAEEIGRRRAIALFTLASTTR